MRTEGGTTPPLARKCKDEFPDLFTFHSLISSKIKPPRHNNVLVARENTYFFYFLFSETVKICAVRKRNISIFSLVRHQEVSQEAPFDIPENDPGESWPEHGEIVFDNYQARIAREFN